MGRRTFLFGVGEEENLLKVPSDVNFEFILPCDVIKTHIANYSMWLCI